MCGLEMKVIKTTIVGGLIFLIPVLVAVMLVGKAFELMLNVAVPLGEIIPVDSVGGVAVANVIAVVAILVICFIAGLIGGSNLGQNIFKYLDDKLSLLIPGYAFIKGITDGVNNGNEDTQSLKPVLVRFDDQLQAAFEVERNETIVVIFIPGAPDARSGGVAYVTPDRVEPLDSNFISVISSMKRFGKGSSAFIDEPRLKGIVDKME